MLDVKKDDFRVAEMKKYTVIKLVLFAELGYHVFKVVLPFVTLVNCESYGAEQCAAVS